MQSNESQGQRRRQGDLAEIAAQIDEVTVGHPEKKAKFCKRIQKVIQEAENYGRYLRDEWQKAKALGPAERPTTLAEYEKAKETGLTYYDEKKDKEEWFWWTAHSNDFMMGRPVYFSGDECLHVQFYIRGKPKPDPLSYLCSMIWGAVGQPYERLERLDYQFVLLAIIHDAQNWQAGRERIYFNPLHGGDLPDRLCRAVWGHLEDNYHSYGLRDVRQTIEAAMLAVRASLDNEKPQNLNEQPDKGGQSKLAKVPISELIRQGEGHTVEFKETLDWGVKQNQHNPNLNRECLKTIAAFLNTDGGTLLIGVRDNGDVTGIERDLKSVQRKNCDGFELKLRNLIRNRFTPVPLGKVKVNFDKRAKGTVCRVDVTPVRSHQIIHMDDELYIRDGNTTVKLTGKDLTDWIQQRARSARNEGRE
jgi:Schlafen, AlbA_2